MASHIDVLSEENRSRLSGLDVFYVSWKDFSIIWLGALLLLLLIVFEPWLWFLSPVRLLLGLIYILYVPGYCLTAALFPNKDDLDGIERTGLSIGLSIAIVPLLALLLDRLPWGIRLWPILWGEYGTMALCTRVALSRRASLPVGEAYAPELSWRPRPWWRSLAKPEKRIYMLLASALLLAGFSTAWVFLVPSPDEFMTEFYILGQEGLAQDYPRQVAPNEEMSVTMGMVNHERDEHHYRVEVWAVDSWADQRQLVAEAKSVVLSPGDEQESLFTWAMPSVGDEQKVEFLLFIDDDPTPYRQLRLWLDVVEHKK